MVETAKKPSSNRSAKERRNTQTLRSQSKVTVIALSIYLMFPFHVLHEISNSLSDCYPKIISDKRIIEDSVC
jgi:hypothetical protein